MCPVGTRGFVIVPLFECYEMQGGKFQECAGVPGFVDGGAVKVIYGELSKYALACL